MSVAPNLNQPSTSTDPESLGWMRGFPPSPDRTITFQDGSFRSFPELRWAWSNIRQLVPTVNVWRGAGPASLLPREDHDIGAVASTTMDGRPMTFAKMLEETYTDGIAVLHRGRLIYERYFGALKPHKPHIAMSVTKSFTGVLAGILVTEGKIDPQAPVTDYVPELKASAFGDARVHEVMDMTTGLLYTEVYTDKNSDVWGLRRANGMAPIPPGYEGATTIFDFLIAQKKQGEHGKAFAYKTVNTDVLAWIVRRASGMTLSDLLSERIWQPMGRRRTRIITSTASAPRAAAVGSPRRCAISPASARPCAITAASTVGRSCRHKWSRTSHAAATLRSSNRPATPRCRAPRTETNGGSRTTRTAPTWRAAFTARASTSIQRPRW
nr:serine hydrolase domain-containing protein [Bradyrhizobium sp. DOA1]